MPFLNDPSFMQAIIMDHYKYPHNKRTVTDESYKKVHMDSESCIDDIYVEALSDSLKQELILGKFIYDIDELYGFLESYTS